MLSVARDLSRKIQPSDVTVSTIATLAQMAQEAEKHNDLAQAESLLKSAITEAEAHFGCDSIAVATLLWDLSIVFHQLGKDFDADRTACRVRAILSMNKRRRLSS